MTTTRIAINGAAGRMGKRLVALGAADPNFSVAAALEYAGHPDVDKDAGALAGVEPIGVALTESLDVDVDAVIDFSVPEAADSVTAMCVDRKLPLVMATTGLSPDQQSRLTEASHQIAMVWAPNMSLAVNLTMKLASTVAGALKDHPSGADVEIIERHHHFKEDAPSGTALKFGQIISDVMGQSQHVHGRHGRPGPRPRSEIAYHALRVGDNPGEHTIVFGLMGESIELTVRSTSRDCYALGALAAARFVAGKTPGMYSMYDVLGL